MPGLFALLLGANSLIGLAGLILGARWAVERSGSHTVGMARGVVGACLLAGGAIAFAVVLRSIPGASGA